MLCRFYSLLTGPSCGVGYWTGEEAVFRGIGEPKARESLLRVGMFGVLHI